MGTRQGLELWGGVLPPRDSKKQAKRLTKRWGRDPETQRHRPRGSTDSKMGETVGRQDKRRRDTASEMGRQTQLERRRQRAGGPGLPPHTPAPAPTQQTRAGQPPLPPARLCQARDSAPLSWFRSGQLGGGLGPGGGASTLRQPPLLASLLGPPPAPCT